MSHVNSAAPRAPRLVAEIEDLALVVHRALPGTSLHRLAFDEGCRDERRASALVAVGAAVARFHGGDVIAGAPRVSSADEVAHLRTYVPAVGVLDSAAAGRFDHAVGLAARAAAALLGHDVGVPSHGSLRTDQVMLSEGPPGLLDVDRYCAAPRERDLGNFVAYLRWRAMRRPQDLAVAVAARNAFLEGYERTAGTPRADAQRFFEAASLLKIAGRRYRGLSVQEWPLVPGLIDAAVNLLGAPS